MADPLEQFVKHLEDSGILAGDTLRDFLPPRKHPKDALELLKDLLKQKKLTKYQAQQIRKGKGKSLVLGNYILLDKIGQGGMGTVYKAEHRRMKRIVAIKTLPRDLMKDPRAGARFQREVEAAAQLRHPNIVAADDADEVKGVYFLVMEYIDGDNLLTTVKENGPLAVPVAVDYILQAARGLEFAHKKGIVHRDIKPSNFLLDPEGAVKILDMGLARINVFGDGISETELTHTGAVLGTVDYMAPEQTLDAKEADHRADIYGLGCTLYYLLVGKKMYDGDTVMKRVMAHRFDPIPSLLAFRADVPAELDAVYQKMVAKNKIDRYQTATEVLAAISPFAAPGLGLGLPAGSSSVQFSVPPAGLPSAPPSASASQFLNEPTLPPFALVPPPGLEPGATPAAAAAPEPSYVTDPPTVSDLAPPRGPAGAPQIVFATFDSLPPVPAPTVSGPESPPAEFTSDFRSQPTDVPVLAELGRVESSRAEPRPAESVSQVSSDARSVVPPAQFGTEFRSQLTDAPVAAAAVPALPVSQPAGDPQTVTSYTEFNTEFRSQSTNVPVRAAPEPVALKPVAQVPPVPAPAVPVPVAPVPAPEKAVERKFEPTSTDRSSEPGHGSTDRSFVRDFGSSSDRSSEASVDVSSQRSTERSLDRAAERSTERSTGHTVQRSFERSVERSTATNIGGSTDRTVSGTARARIREPDSQSANQTWRANRPAKDAAAQQGAAGWKSRKRRRRMFGATVVYLVLLTAFAALLYLLLK